MLVTIDMNRLTRIVTVTYRPPTSKDGLIVSAHVPYGASVLSVLESHANSETLEGSAWRAAWISLSLECRIGEYS